MVDVAWKMLFHDTLRFAIAVTGAAFALTLIFVQVGRRSPAFHQLSGPTNRPRTSTPTWASRYLSGFATSPRAKTELCRS